MRFKIVGASLALVAAVLAAPLAQAEDEGVYENLIDQKMASIVSVKLVLSVKVSHSGQVIQEQDANIAATGVVVDASGLVMLPVSTFEPPIPRRMRRQFEIQSTPSSLRVVFPGDTKEYDAVLGAQDSKLGLAFVLIKDLAGKKIVPVDMTRTVEPVVGSTLYGVTRLDEGFDHAPMCTRARIAGSVTKPRTMWIIQGAGGHTAKPMYDATGAVAGVVVQQEGVGDSSEIRQFLLPLKVAVPTVAGALKKAKDELEAILDAEAEKAEEEAEAKKAEAEGAAKDEPDGKGEDKGAEKKDPEKKDPEKKEGDGGDK